MTIEERLEIMERELGRIKRRNRWLLGAILVLLGGLVAAGVFKTMITPVEAQGAGTANEIRARSIHIEDENGNSRIALGLSKDGPFLRLYDANSKPRIALGLSKDSPCLVLANENGKVGAILNLLNNSGSLGLADENGEYRAMLDISNGPLLKLLDENGTIRVTLNYLALLLSGEDGKYRAALGNFKDGPVLELYDEKGNLRFVAGKQKTSSPDGKIIEYPESSLILYGPDGKVIWSAIK